MFYSGLSLWRQSTLLQPRQMVSLWQAAVPLEPYTSGPQLVGSFCVAGQLTTRSHPVHLCQHLKCAFVHGKCQYSMVTAVGILPHVARRAYNSTATLSCSPELGWTFKSSYTNDSAKWRVETCKCLLLCLL